MSDLVPPHDLDAEAAVLSAMICDRGAIDIALDLIAPEHFFSDANRRICEAICELFAKSEPVDSVTVAGVLRERGRFAQIGGAPYLATIVEFTPSIANVGAYAKRVRDKWAARELVTTCRRLAAEAHGPIDDTSAFLDQAERAIFAIGRRRDERDVAPMSSVMTESFNHMRQAEMRGGTVELTTGLVELDKLLGGLGRDRLTVIAARPGMGKTALATGMAEAVAATVGPVAIFSLEMPRAQLGMRMACTRAGAAVFRGVNGWLGDMERARVIKAHDELKRLPIWIDDTPGLGLMRLRAKSRVVSARADAPLALVVVDYLQLMAGSGEKGRTRDREVSDITAGLKRLSKELNCSVVLLSQLNREVEQERDKRPRLHHLRESGGIEQDADDVVFVYRDDYYHADSDDPGTAELIIAKQRNGPTGVVKVAFHAASTAFTDIAA